MVDAVVDVERLADAQKQVLLIELRIPLDGIVLVPLAISRSCATVFFFNSWYVYAIKL